MALFRFSLGGVAYGKVDSSTHHFTGLCICGETISGSQCDHLSDSPVITSWLKNVRTASSYMRAANVDMPYKFDRVN